MFSARACWWLKAASAAAVLHSGVVRAQAQAARATPLGLDAYYPVPTSNPMTSGAIALGRRLFFDTQLSLDSTRSCASCHQPAAAFADSLAYSRGVRGRETLRNAPSLFNRAYGGAFFWDGRAASLEETVMQPIANPREMGLELPALVKRLRNSSSYRGAFRAEYPDGVTQSSIARSLASYVRSLRAGNSPVDRYMAGDARALSSDAIAGLKIFTGRGRCIACHVGPTFTDERFHNTGVSAGGEAGRRLVTGVVTDDGKFKVPSLRNVALTAPYMHDGSLATLEAVVDFYDGGGGPNPNLDPEIHTLHLGPEARRFLVAFLRSLTSEP